MLKYNYPLNVKNAFRFSIKKLGKHFLHGIISLWIILRS